MDAHPKVHWIEVNYLEFDRYIREYPRTLVADPPLNRPARLREWFDVSLGNWPQNAVAKQLDAHNRCYLVRVPMSNSAGDTRLHQGTAPYVEG